MTHYLLILMIKTDHKEGNATLNTAREEVAKQES